MLLRERYKIVGLLGRRAMGEVYRGRDFKLEQHVALMFFPPPTVWYSRLLQRFRGEVRVVWQVTDRNVWRVYDPGEINGVPSISMKYIDGEDLGSLLHRIGPLTGDETIEFTRRLCAGAVAAHGKRLAASRSEAPKHHGWQSSDFGLATFSGEL